MSSIYQQLERVRKPRVHIKYEVETEEGAVKKELPFVVGVMGDFVGNPQKAPKPFKERKFITIDKDNFNEVMQRLQPELNLVVDNKLGDHDEKMSVQLKFKSMDDFNPENIVNQVPALKALLEARNRLRDLLTKADCSDQLENFLEETLQDPKKLQHLATELGENS